MLFLSLMPRRSLVLPSENSNWASHSQQTARFETRITSSLSSLSNRSFPRINYSKINHQLATTTPLQYNPIGSSLISRPCISRHRGAERSSGSSATPDTSCRTRACSSLGTTVYPSHRRDRTTSRTPNKRYNRFCTSASAEATQTGSPPRSRPSAPL